MNKRGLIFALFTALVSGFSIFINKFGLKGFDPYIFTGMKNLAVVIFLLSTMLLLGELKELRMLNAKQWLRLCLIGLVGGSIPFLLFFKGLSMSSAATGSFMHKTMFVFVAIGAVIFLKEKLNRSFIIGALLIMAGNALLFKFYSISFTTADLLVLLAALFWSAENLISKDALKEISPRTVAFGRMSIGFFFILLFWAFTGRIDSALSLTMPQLSWILLTSAFLFLYVIAWYDALQSLKASVATSILVLGSPITTLLSFAFLGESVTILQAFGMLMIVAGVVFAVGVSRIRFNSIPAKA